MPKSISNYADKNKGRLYRNYQRKQNYSKSLSHATNKNRPYTKEECDIISKHSISDFELSQIIGRSVEAIQTKRHKLHKQEICNER